MADPQYLSPSESNTRSAEASSELASVAHGGGRAGLTVPESHHQVLQSILVCWVALFKVNQKDPIPDCLEGHSNRKQQHGKVKNYIAFLKN